MKNMARLPLGIMALVVMLVPMVACAAPAPAAVPTTAPAPAAAPAGGTAPAGVLPLEVTPVLDGKANEPCTVTATTAPGAKCTIQLINPVTGTKSSYPPDKEKVADASGKAVWTWTIHRDVAKGDGSLTVTAELGAQKATKQVVFRVIAGER